MFSNNFHDCHISVEETSVKTSQLYYDNRNDEFCCLNVIVHIQTAAIQKLRNSLGIGQLSSRLCVGCQSRHQDKAPEGSHFHTNVFCPLTSPPKTIIPGKTDWTNCICNSACWDISNDLGAFISSCIWTLQKS